MDLKGNFFLAILRPQLLFIYRLWFFVFCSLPYISFACTIVLPHSDVCCTLETVNVIPVLQMHSARELPSIQVCENLMNSLRTTQQTYPLNCNVIVCNQYDVCCCWF